LPPPFLMALTKRREPVMLYGKGYPEMHIIHEPKIYILGRQTVSLEEVARFLEDQGTAWATDSEVGAERLCELAGRVCYMSFGAKQGRKSSAEYLANIISSEHGSVLEHAVWNLLITGVSRSFTHEFIRHRAGFGYSQLSQRYVDESEADFVEPESIAQDPELHALWLSTIEASHEAYRKLVEGLAARIEREHPSFSKTLKRKMARQASRSVLPNATETKIFVTANARALRHFIELRASEGAEPEIRRVAVAVLRVMQQESPNLFGDYEVYSLADGSEGVRTEHRKV
jgi:thymidylate synthase (FAD)